MENEFAPVEFRPYDIAADRQMISESLIGTDELDAVVSTIDVGDLNTITSFGKETAERIARASDAVLESVSVAQISESDEVMVALAKIMSKINISEIESEGKGLFHKLAGNSSKQADRIYEKYTAIGEEVNRIFIKLKQFEAEIRKSNYNLTLMFEANTDYYRTLVKYITAGEQGCREIEDYLNELREEYSKSGDKGLFMEMENLENALTLLQNRTLDLRVAESVAIQSVPMIKAMEYSNVNLINKINGAFMVTLPMFGQSIMKAAAIKRQSLENQAMDALNRQMEEFILENAVDNIHREQLEQRLSESAKGNKFSGLSELHRSITESIGDVKKLQSDSAKQRIDCRLALAKAKARFDGLKI